MSSSDTIGRALDPKLRGPFVLLAALGAGVVVVLVGYATFTKQVRALAREEVAPDAFKTQQVAADVARLSTSVDKLERDLLALDRQIQELLFRSRLDREQRRDRGSEHR